ncbi:dUTPase [Chrysodeixis chalcites nucleopolyhedrovirus]|uniref:dUTP diphosphatase n=1 Tax=Chrysodeixis chalcites nucleopolyhedrovirus TaxID=320432 RepID=Q4KSW1_9ABAC|nr:dUTPase [Chrysodeixis chalcites nucleopolyhedrovirus]AAY84050.1 dUTPase [Chrysodeixis chalcites nucleopolyhedrovirus]AGC36333.1 dUTPase [Chrysodeixis chalcites SNPV TF1-A]AGE61679.1 dUTPase [Chrysodeixis chalcites nucleopolyhedrovirus]
MSTANKRSRLSIEDCSDNEYYHQEQHENMYFKKLNKDAIAPQRATLGSAGYDLYTPTDVCLKPQKWTVVDIGIAIQLPPKRYGRIAERSGLATKHGIGIQAGIIDTDYRGPVGVCLINRSKKEYNFKKGDKIAQMIIESYHTPNVIMVDELDDTDRGSGGFGSTGQ